ncbi:MAG: GTP 3',8-cyclase MoaA [Negativicutes bacterium]|nr:GTP 3',8-cyclase MoaA [Negativicutes bacterium]
MLTDGRGRRITYLRVSVTDRCNFRCWYCMPASGIRQLDMAEILSFEEISGIVGILAEQGINTIRLTGGEPLVRRGIVRLVEMLSAVAGSCDLAMTTNGSLLAPLASGLRVAGLRRLNISLDSPDPDQFRRITRGGSLADVWQGYEAAVRAGFTDIKFNAVITADDRLENQVRAWWREIVSRRLVVRFIEQMPIGYSLPAGSPGTAGRLLDTLAAVSGVSPRLTGERLGCGPAEYYDLAGIRIGLIRALSHGFCQSCNRIRLTADGRLLTCLADGRGVDLKAIVRAGGNIGQIKDRLIEAVKQAVAAKPAGHEMSGGPAAGGYMTQIGG